MTKAEIAETVQQFKRAALLARDSGFHGVQIHCSCAREGVLSNYLVH